MSWLPVVVIEPPAAEPIGVDEVCAHTRTDAGPEAAAELAPLIAGARDLIEKYTGTRLVTQTVLMRASSFDDLERLATAPVQQVTSIGYLDASGEEQMLPANVYETILVGLEPGIRLKPGRHWPATLGVKDAVRVTAVAGYGDAALVTATVRLALLVTIAALYQEREAGTLPTAAMTLLANDRINP